MAEDKKEEKVDQETLKGLLAWVQQKKEESQQQGQPWGWVMAVIAAVIVFVTLAFAAYEAWKKGREIAQLKHQLDKEAEARLQAEIDAKVTAEQEQQRAFQAQVVEHQKKIDTLTKEIVVLEDKRRAENQKIDKITSWEDLDEIIR